MTDQTKRGRGKPALPDAERRKPVSISMAPETRALFDALGPGKHRIANDLLHAALVARKAQA